MSPRITMIKGEKKPMFEFNRLCKAFEEIDPKTFKEVIAEKSASIVSALSAITRDGMDGMGIYLNFILCSIVSDGKLAEEEYGIIRPAFEIVAGKDVDYEEAVTIFNEYGLNRPNAYKRTVDDMVDILGLISLDLKRDIIIVCMMVCSIDGKISRKEKRWIRQLIR